MSQKLRNLLYAITATGLLGIAGCERGYREPEIPRLSGEVYKEEGLKKILFSLAQNERDRELTKMIYKNPDEVKKRMSEEMKKDYELWDLKDLNGTEFEKYIDKDLNESDRMALFVVKCMKIGPWYGEIKLF